jgi:glutamate-1-semialdehyde 2,1-aminomutase
VIVDPLSNRAGLFEPREQFLSHLRKLTRRLGILLIFDEVISFRIDYRGAQGHYGVRPDLSALGKIVGGGFPVGVTGGSAEVMSVFDPTSGKPKIASGGTFAGNPVTMVAGKAAMEKLTPAEYDRLAGLGDRLRAEANEAFRRRRVPGQILGVGSLFRIHGTDAELTRYRETTDPAAAARVLRLHSLMLGEGVVVHTNGLACLSTPMGEAEVDAFIAALDRALVRMR